MSEDTAPIIPPSIPKELEDLVGAVIGTATTHNLLDSGLFPQAKHKVIQRCMAFQKALYEKSLADAFAHPAWELSEDLKRIHTQRVMEEEAQREESEAKVVEAVEAALPEGEVLQ